MPFAPVLLFIIFALVIWNLISKAVRGKNLGGSGFGGGSLWRETAKQLNLDYVPPTREFPQPALTGKINGLNVEVFQMDPAPESNIFCIVQFPKALIPGFYLSNFKDADEWVQASPVETTFPGCFPSNVRVRAHDQLQILPFLNRRRINILKNAFGSSLVVEVKEEYFMLAEPGILKPERLAAFIQRTAGFAAAFAADSETAGVPYVPDSIEKKPPVQVNPQDTAAIYDFLHNAPQTEKKAVAPEPEVIVADPVPEPVPDPVPEPEPAAEPLQDDLSASNVVQNLFGVPFPGAAERAYFESVSGKTVCWQGTLRGAYPYGTDFVFGKGPGCKATFVLPDLTGKNGIRISVKATVMLPASAADALKCRNGETFSFSGTLMKFEPFAHEIFIRDGALK